MSAITLGTPLVVRRPVRQRRASASVVVPIASSPKMRPRRAAVEFCGGEPARRRSAAHGAAVGQPRPLRLTRRGRAVLHAATLVAACSAAVAGGVVTFSADATAVPVQYRTVQVGETLWAIAGEVAPDADRRETAAAIRHLNDLGGSTLRTGQQIAVPSR